LNEVYTVTDTALTLKYKFDYSDFNPFEKEKMGAFESYEDIKRDKTVIVFITGHKHQVRIILCILVNISMTQPIISFGLAINVEGIKNAHRSDNSLFDPRG